MTGDRRRVIAHDGPAPRFFEAALLGNGSLGVAVSTRPDAIMLRLGNNNVWDRRIDESHADDILTFDEVFARVQAIDAGLAHLEEDAWFADYRAKMVAPYARPYPRPLPCGSLILGFDPREVEVLGHELDLLTGVCTVSLLASGAVRRLEIFVDQTADDVHVRCLDESGAAVDAPFRRVALLPDPDGPTDAGSAEGGRTTFILPKPGDVPVRDGVSEIRTGRRHEVAFRESLPALDGAAPLGRFEVSFRASGALHEESRIDWYGAVAPPAFLERSVAAGTPWYGVLSLRYAYGDDEPALHPHADEPADAEQHAQAAAVSLADWGEYWSRSRIALSDDFLEDVWYRSTYFLHCATRPGSAAPGLFGSWLYRGIGSAWHGDYHMNYNAQQVYWGAFSSNRVEAHLPYVDLVTDISEIARRWAGDYYRMAGAAYPHSAYNAPMSVNPYPNPVWAWEVCESPWTVQSLWWHYTYTMDRTYLRDAAMPRIREVVEFLVDYLSRPECSGPQWADDRIHVFPTVPPELYGLTPGLRNNADALIDIALIRFVFDAFAQGCAALGVETENAGLLQAAAGIGARLPDYATADTDDGPVFVSVPGEHPETVYNVPIPGMTVFPGEQHSWESSADIVDTAIRSVRRQRLEGGNELVFANLQAARLGVLDLGRFSRQLRYCELPNGTFTDMTLQTGGRYNDATDFAFMDDKGIWTENFALTAVINEMLVQAYSGTVRLFPNCQGLTSAGFERLRVPGAFLLAARMEHGEVLDVEVASEVGGDLRILLPWDRPAVLERDGGTAELAPGIAVIATSAGETVRLRPAAPRA